MISNFGRGKLTKTQSPSSPFCGSPAPRAPLAPPPPEPSQPDLPFSYFRRAVDEQWKAARTLRPTFGKRRVPRLVHPAVVAAWITHAVPSRLHVRTWRLGGM